MKSVPLPRIGMRVVKTAVAVMLSYTIFVPFGLIYNEALGGVWGQLGPLYACIACIICTQSTLGQTIQQGLSRLIGVAVGGALGTATLLLGAALDDPWVRIPALGAGRAAVRHMFDQLTRREFLRGWRGIAQCLHPEKHFSFDAPLLVCRGERDRTGTIARHMEDWKRAWPETETAVLPGAAHVVNLDAPEAFNRLLLDFLTRCGGSRRGRR